MWRGVVVEMGRKGMERDGKEMRASSRVYQALAYDR